MPVLLLPRVTINNLSCRLHSVLVVVESRPDVEAPPEGISMPLASFLEPLETMPQLAAPAAANMLGGAAATSHALPGFSVQRQQQTNWCWAAVSASVAAFYGTPGWQQCTIAAAELAPYDCCGGDARTHCNVAWFLNLALVRVGHFDRSTTPNAPFSNVQGEINVGRPLGCRIQWFGNNNGAHFVAIGGWLVAGNGTEYVDVYDPIYGFSQITYTSLCSSYSRLGDSWTHSYFTK